MDRQEKARQVYERLRAIYGERTWSPHGDPVDELIGTILSANTNDVNSGRAFDRLKAAFGEDWEAVRTAPLEAIKEAIRPAGMYNQKAPNIVATLTRIKEDWGEYRLDALAEMDVKEALAYLTSLPGVGHKTASIVLLFCFNKPTFPVDTHVQRISRRLGISSRKASAEKVKADWEALLPPETFYTLHLNLIRHGREICHAREPRCEICPLQDLCDYYNQEGDWAPTPPGQQPHSGHNKKPPT
ncbi:endonuclease III [Litorilinea aerophila]|uniref:Endonuclease III n=1 Tax=Litorilinea aerophila TaxID=1204385 RepID=A0A540V9V0_9CHLR|nr:endonuclease III [Litorilinea aerophila]MCC9078608.1 endonuclease III [Litorilinea aerophila]